MSVDLSPAALAAAAGVDPWTLARRVGAGDPAGLQAGGLRVRRAGLLAAEAARDGGRADLVLANGFHNDGLAVFDAPASNQRCAVALAERGEKIEEVARVVLDVAAALRETAASTESKVAALDTDLSHLHDRLRQVRMTGPDPAAVPGAVAAAEQRYHALAVDLVRRAGALVRRDVDANNALLVNRTARLEGLGYGATPAGTASGPSAAGPVPGDATAAVVIPGPPPVLVGSALAALLAWLIALTSRDEAGVPPVPTPATPAPAPSASSPVPRPVDDVLNELPAGRNPGVRTVGSEAELDRVHRELTQNGRPIEVPGYPGSWTERPDGVRIGLRDSSKSGGKTIDIRYSDGTTEKVHAE
jgi:hypothetical protein